MLPTSGAGKRAGMLQGLSRYVLKQTWKVKVKLLSRAQLFATPWTVAYQASQSMECSRQQYWSGLPFPSPGDLLNPGIESAAPISPVLQADYLLLSHQGIRFPIQITIKY